MSLKKVKERLEAIKCPIHGQSPEIEISGEVLSYKGCCPEFGKTIDDKACCFTKEEDMNDLLNILKM